jgi:hypothetical protein
LSCGQGEASAPVQEGLTDGKVPGDYVEHPTYSGGIPGRENIFEESAFPGAPDKAAKTGPGSGSKRYSYYLAAKPTKGLDNIPQEGSPTSTGVMINTPVVITGGSIPEGQIFRTSVDSYTTANDMTWDGYRYASFTFSPEPPDPTSPYKFYFAPKASGGVRRGSKRYGSKRHRKGRKGTRRH